MTNYVELKKILEVFNSITIQLAKENNKFQYSVIKNMQEQVNIEMLFNG